MKVWYMLGLICLCGAIGGIVNALIIDQGLIKPRKERTESFKVYRPGFIGNIFTGAIAAGISWGLYGPLSGYIIIEVTTPPAGSPAPIGGLTLSSLVGAVLVGVGGARWLTNEVDKSLLKTAASIAAGAKAAPELAKRIAMASTDDSVEIMSEVKKAEAPIGDTKP